MKLVVAGQTRSGLTLTMQMLHAGGVPCACKPPSFECYEIGEIPWQEFEEGTAVKVVDTQNHFPPGKHGPYRVIRLARDPKQQCVSFNNLTAMAGQGRPMNMSKLSASFRKHYRKIDSWGKRQHAFMTLKFEDIIRNPTLAATKLQSFSALPGFDVRAAAAMVKERQPECVPGTLLELDMFEG